MIVASTNGVVDVAMILTNFSNSAAGELETQITSLIVYREALRDKKVGGIPQVDLINHRHLAIRCGFLRVPKPAI